MLPRTLLFLILVFVLAPALHAAAQAEPDRIAIKLHDDSGARLERGELVSTRADLTALRRLLGVRGVRAGSLARTFTRAPEVLRAERERAIARGGRALPDLSLFFNVTVPAHVSQDAFAAELRALAEVESAEPWPRPMLPPVDLAPPTPDFTGAQTYLSPGPSGIGRSLLDGIPGVDGAGVRLIDIEYEWRIDHEDLELAPQVFIDTGTAQNPFPDQGNHGNAVLGILAARANGYGVTGIAPAAQLRLAAAYTAERSWDPGYALERALDVALAGDVILIEQQVCVCDQTCSSGSQAGAGPLEWFAPWRAAIAHATSLGIVVVEAAGNGSVNLDATACNGVFDRAQSDSGAIIVGAGSASTHAPLAFTSYGSRVDLQGIGEGLTTLGGGALFDPGDTRQRYQSSFGGTSGASALVAGVLLSVQGLRHAAGLAPLKPRVARELLRQTGTPQAADPRVIGPLPDLEAAFAAGLAPPIPALSPALSVALAALLLGVVALRGERV